MMLRNLYVGTLFGISILLVDCVCLHAQTETQDFASAASAEAAGWIFNEEAQNPDRDCDDLGLGIVQLVAIDAAGNADTCMHYIAILDTIGFCQTGPDSLVVVATARPVSCYNESTGSV